MIGLLGIEFHLYGIILAFALGMSYVLFGKILRREQIKVDVDSLAIWILFAGVIGARTYHVITDWQLYQNDWFEAFKIWEGGLGLIGAIGGGLIGLWLGLRQQFKLKEFSKILDIIFLITPLAQAVGRWGNYFNQELFGLPTTLPWGVSIEQAQIPDRYQQFSSFHPLFFYESILSICLFLCLVKGYRSQQWNIGQLQITGIYLMGYSAIRFSLEFLRIETARWSGNWGVLSIAQWIMVVVFVFGLFLFLKNRGQSHV